MPHQPAILLKRSDRIFAEDFMAKLCSAFVGLSNVMPDCLAGLTICEHAAASFLAGCLEGCGGENGSLAGNRLCQRRLTNTTEVVPSVRSKRSERASDGK